VQQYSREGAPGCILCSSTAERSAAGAVLYRGGPLTYHTAELRRKISRQQQAATVGSSNQQQQRDVPLGSCSSAQMYMNLHRDAACLGVAEAACVLSALQADWCAAKESLPGGRCVEMMCSHLLYSIMRSYTPAAEQSACGQLFIASLTCSRQHRTSSHDRPLSFCI
jgi:hypothetical protein